MIKIKVIAFALLLSGCGLTPQGDMVRQFLIERGQKAADQTAENAKDYLCKWARVESITKLFSHPSDRRAYLTLCAKIIPLFPIPKQQLDGLLKGEKRGI